MRLLSPKGFSIGGDAGQIPSARRCDNVFGWIGPVGVLAMNSVHHGWFFNNKEWIEFIVLTVVLWLLTMTAISVFDLRSAG